MNFSEKLTRDFYNRPTIEVARDLLGRILVRKFGGSYLTGRIVETEAYLGADDKASHAARGRTPRADVMFGPPGHAYVYFIYGMYNCLNFVTEPEGIPAAVLIRAVEPLSGIEQMKKLRGAKQLHQLTSGPGKLCQAFAIDRTLNRADLTGDALFVSVGEPVPRRDVVATPRIGVTAAKDLLRRFHLKGSPFVSGPSKLP